jgi:hypothetical protein
MAVVQSSDMIKELSLAAGLQNSQGIPTKLADTIVPVCEVNPKLTRAVNIVRFKNSSSTSTGETIYAVPRDSDFYLTSIQLSMSKDATCDGTVCTLNGTVQGVSSYLLSIGHQTLTVFSGSETQAYSPPIKIDRNTNIYMTGTFSLGTMNKRCTITGFTIDSANA